MVGVRNPGSSRPRVEGELVGGKYKLEGQLGEGGMAVVFAARHMGTGRRVAVKCILSHANSSTANARFMREAKAAGRIDHPNVVQVLDVGEDSRGRYIVMECLQGETLADVLQRRRLAAPDAIDVLIPALRGVHAAHKQGIVHRDLKPENIFVGRAGDGPVQIKVLDFGISKYCQDDDSQELTRTGALLGTPQYMSPERVLGQGHADRRNDVYAMGVILYEALAGFRPFDGVDVHEVVKKIAKQNVRALSEVDPTLPAELISVVRKAMAPSAEDRYQDIEGFARALEPFAGCERFQLQVRDPTEEAGSAELAEATSVWEAPDPRVEAQSPKPGAPRVGPQVRQTPEAGMRSPAAGDAQGPRPPRPPAAATVAARSSTSPRAPRSPSVRSKAADDAIRDEYEPVQTLQIVEVPTREPEREARLAQPPTPIAGAADSVDLAIDNLLAGAANARPLPNPEARRHDLQAAAETFRSAAPALARPLSELMFQLSVGRTPRGWAIACQAVVTSLLEAAKRVELEELATSLEHFDAALKRAVIDAGPSIDAATAAALQAAYGHLTSQLPDAFPAASEADGRRKLLFEAVVLRAPAMRMRILAKLYAAGVNSLEQLCRTTPEELSTAAGIDRELAQALTRRAQQFNRERHQDPADLQTQTERRLRALRQRLEALQSEFERAEREDLAERKRAVRQGREAALLELNQLLAEAGEFELANELQRYSTSGKILSIESYLKRAQTGPE